MTERPDAGDIADQPALDSGEKWGQGTDASHPRSATGQPIPESPESREPAADEPTLDRPPAENSFDPSAPGG